MNETSNPKGYSAEDIRIEYQVVSDYHSSIVSSRFTVAGLYVAAIGFVAGAVFSADTSWWARWAGSVLALWLSICLWVLELRSRALFTNIAHRGIEIEHKYWGLTDIETEWFNGFFSRMYKEPPNSNHGSNGELDRRKEPDRPRFAWSRKPLSVQLSKYISHSMGLDLLFLGGIVFWSLVSVVSLFKIIF